MKSKLIQKLIAASAITGTIFSMVPGKVLADGFGNIRWIMQNENWYCYSDGHLQKGWIKYNDRWYYTDRNGVMQKGVIQIDGKVYVFAESGEMQTGSTIINGKVYYIDDSGALRGSELPTPSKTFDWNITRENNSYPENTINSSNNSTNRDEPLVAYDPLAPKEKFEVTFKDDDGEKLKIKKVEDGSIIKLYEPEKRGYRFIEWNTKKNGNGKSYDADDEYKVEKNITLYAIFEEVDADDKDADEAGVVKVTDITISSEGNAKEITTDKGTLKFTAEVLPVNADNDKVTWSVTNETGKASISSSGLLKAEADGTVVVKAEAKDGSGIYDTVRISISNQKDKSDNQDGSNNGNNGNQPDKDNLPQITGDDKVILASGDSLQPGTYGTIRLNCSKDIEGVKANKIIVNGGSVIRLKNCQVNYLEVLNPEVGCKIILEDGTVVQYTDIEKGITLTGSEYKVVNVDTSDVVTIDKDAVIGQLNINELNSKIKIDGKVNEVNVSEEADKSTIQGTGTITKLNTKANTITLNINPPGSVGTITGNASNSEGKDKLGEAQELQKYTSLVEEKENANKQVSTSDAVYVAVEGWTKNKNAYYLTEWEDLLFRLKNLNDKLQDSVNLEEAIRRITAVEKYMEINPACMDKADGRIFIKEPSDGTGILVAVGASAPDSGYSQYSVAEFENQLEKAEKSIKGLNANVYEKSSLQNRLDKVNSRKKSYEDLVKVIDKISAGTALTAEDYSSLGIKDVTNAESIAVVNKYVLALKNDTQFNDKDKIDDIAANLAAKESLIDVLDNNKRLIINKSNVAKNYITIRNKINSDIASAENQNDSLKTKADTFTIAELSKFKSTLNNINDNMDTLIDQGLDGELLNDNQADKLLEYTKDLGLYTAKYFNRLFNDSFYTSTACTVTDDGQTVNVDLSKNVKPSLQRTKIDEVTNNYNKLINTENSYYKTALRDKFGDDIFTKYNSMLQDVNKKYAEKEEAIAAFLGNIKIAGATAMKNADNISFTGSIQCSTTGYTFGANNTISPAIENTVINADNTVTLTVSVEPKGESGYIMAPQDLSDLHSYSVKIADIVWPVAATETTPAIPGSITFDSQGYDRIITLTKSDGTSSHQFKVSITKSTQSNNKYSCSVTVTLMS